MNHMPEVAMRHDPKIADARNRNARDIVKVLFPPPGPQPTSDRRSLPLENIAGLALEDEGRQVNGQPNLEV